MKPQFDPFPRWETTSTPQRFIEVGGSWFRTDAVQAITPGLTEGKALLYLTTGHAVSADLRGETLMHLAQRVLGVDDLKDQEGPQ